MSLWLQPLGTYPPPIAPRPSPVPIQSGPGMHAVTESIALRHNSPIAIRHPASWYDSALPKMPRELHEGKGVNVVLYPRGVAAACPTRTMRCSTTLHSID